jgi:hypothetical protein
VSTPLYASAKRVFATPRRPILTPTLVCGQRELAHNSSNFIIILIIPKCQASVQSLRDRSEALRSLTFRQANPSHGAATFGRGQRAQQLPAGSLHGMIFPREDFPTAFSPPVLSKGTEHRKVENNRVSTVTLQAISIREHSRGRSKTREVPVGQPCRNGTTKLTVGIAAKRNGRQSNVRNQPKKSRTGDQLREELLNESPGTT